MAATEGNFSVFNDFSVAAIVNLAATVSTNVYAWFDGNCHQLGKSFEKSIAQFPAFLG